MYLLRTGTCGECTYREQEHVGNVLIGGLEHVGNLLGQEHVGNVLTVDRNM